MPSLHTPDITHLDVMLSLHIHDNTSVVVMRPLPIHDQTQIDVRFGLLVGFEHPQDKQQLHRQVDNGTGQPQTERPGRSCHCW